MVSRFLLAVLAVGMMAATADAGPLLKRFRARHQPVAIESTCTKSFAVTPSGVSYSATTTTTVTPLTTEGADALAEVNAKRAARGLPPLIPDPLLTMAAQRAPQHRAERLLFGHSANDFQFLPAGAHASAAGCAAYPAGYGWLSCCVYDRATYGGAAWVTGRDGKRYMHLFIR